VEQEIASLVFYNAKSTRFKNKQVLQNPFFPGIFFSSVTFGLFTNAVSRTKNCHEKEPSFQHLFINDCACTCLFPVLAQKKKAARLSDAKIASVAVAANQVDSQAARLVQQKSKNAGVLNSAKRWSLTTSR
jgi:hypothetical protein